MKKKTKKPEHKVKLALAMIVRGADSEAVVFERCLASVASFMDGIFITITHKKGESINPAVFKVAKKYRAFISSFEWIDNFAAARTFNFSQVPKDYTHIMWTDADDIWRGLPKLKTTIENNIFTDGFAFEYFYEWDEFNKPVVVHAKTMIVKNDGCAQWVGALHEDLEPLRHLEIQLVKGIERLHLTSPERAKAASERNVAIAKEELNISPDDPRTYWNLGNSLFGVADYAGARKTFDEFIKITHSTEEKYLAYCRLADIAKSQGDNEESERYLQTAIGVAPTMPDAFFQLAYLYYSYSNWDKAEEFCIQGLLRKPVRSKMIVFNPRDYDYNPLFLLAQIYYQKNRPHDMLTCLEGCLKIYPYDKHLQRMVQEGKVEKRKMARALDKVKKLMQIKDLKKLRKELDALPIDLKSHPAVAMLRNKYFIKTESSGRDLVIYCGQTFFEWNPILFKKKGFGGSEEAVINLSRELAKLGWNVTVYNNCGHKEVSADGVLYRPFWEWNYRDKQDAVILWRWARPLDAPINAPVVLIDMHDVVPKGEFTEARIAKVTKVMVKTKFHRSLFPNVPDHKIAVVPNGMDLSLFTGQEKKDPYLLINTSSPDRSMDVLPKLFTEIKKRVPKARLQWAYGWEGFKTSNAEDPKKLKWMEETIAAMEEAGIETLGRLPQSEIAKLYERASIFAYPTEFAEIDCISVKKAQAAGCLPVTTDFAALPESVKVGVLVHSPKTKDTWNKPYQFHFGIEDESTQSRWVEAVVQQLKAGIPDAKFIAEKMQDFTWDKIAVEWDKILRK